MAGHKVGRSRRLRRSRCVWLGRDDDLMLVAWARSPPGNRAFCVSRRPSRATMPSVHMENRLLSSNSRTATLSIRPHGSLMRRPKTGTRDAPRRAKLSKGRHFSCFARLTHQRLEVVLTPIRRVPIALRRGSCPARARLPWREWLTARQCSWQGHASRPYPRPHRHPSLGDAGIRRTASG